MRDVTFTQALPGLMMPDIPTYMNIRTYHPDSTVALFRFRDTKFIVEHYVMPPRIEEDQTYLKDTAVVLMEPNTPAVQVCMAFDFPEPLRTSHFMMQSRFLVIVNAQ